MAPGGKDIELVVLELWVVVRGRCVPGLAGFLGDRLVCFLFTG